MSLSLRALWNIRGNLTMHSFVPFAVVLDGSRARLPEQDVRTSNQARAAADGSLDSVTDTPRRCIWARLAESVNRNFDEKCLAGAALECFSKPPDTIRFEVLLRDIHRVRKRLYPFFIFFSRCPVCGEWCKLH